MKKIFLFLLAATTLVSCGNNFPNSEWSWLEDGIKFKQTAVYSFNSLRNDISDYNLGKLVDYYLDKKYNILTISNLPDDLAKDGYRYLVTDAYKLVDEIKQNYKICLITRPTIYLKSGKHRIYQFYDALNMKTYLLYDQDGSWHWSLYKD